MGRKEYYSIFGPLVLSYISGWFVKNIQSTNWQTVRFKPPPHNSGMGWRVEFRPMEVQLTDFENAAYVIFVVLLTRAILSFNLNLYIPISKVVPTRQFQISLNLFPDFECFLFV